MTHSSQNNRWLNNPERRVGQTQLLRAMLANLGERDPRYDEIRALLETGPMAHDDPTRLR